MRKLATALFLGLPLTGCTSDPVTADGPSPGPDESVILVEPSAGPTRTHKPQQLDPIDVVAQPPDFDANFPDANFSYEEPPRPDACATTEFVAERLPLDVYIMLDRSGSMNIPLELPPTAAGDCNVGDDVNSRWCRTLGALDGFFSNSSAEGTGVALQYFPNGTCSETPPVGHDCCESGACCGGGPDAVADVELGDPVTQRAALIASLDAQAPLGVTTPIEPALRGIAAWTAAHATPGRSMAGILITDGEPTGCSTNTSLLANIAAQHLANTGIPTFVIGMDGAKFATLEEIAVAGGAAAHEQYCPAGVSPCHVFSVGFADGTAFSAALEQIKGAVVDCHYALPHTDAGVVDPDKLSVVFTTDTETVALERVADVSSCGAGGFFLDPGGDTLSLCQSSCDTLRTARTSEVKIAVQCLGI